MIKLNEGSVVKLSGSPEVILVSALSHEVKFEDGTVLAPNPNLAEVLKAEPTEEVIERVGGISVVAPTFHPTEEGRKLVRKLVAIVGAFGSAVYILSSTISAQAYGLPVVAPITTPETCRKPPEEKICYKHKFAGFQAQ